MALARSEQVAELLRKAGHEVEIVHVSKTSGDSSQMPGSGPAIGTSTTCIIRRCPPTVTGTVRA